MGFCAYSLPQQPTGIRTDGVNGMACTSIHSVYGFDSMVVHLQDTGSSRGLPDVSTVVRYFLDWLHFLVRLLSFTAQRYLFAPRNRFVCVLYCIGDFSLAGYFISKWLSSLDNLIVLFEYLFVDRYILILC